MMKPAILSFALLSSPFISAGDLKSALVFHASFDKSLEADSSISDKAWLRLSPDEDSEPGYCDPVQIVTHDTRKGLIFQEWSEDETPSLLRYAERPVVEAANATFHRDQWIHAAFALSHIYAGNPASTGSYYLKGKLEGDFKGWDLKREWKPESAALVLGAAQVGHLDELKVFNPVLTQEEVMEVMNEINHSKP